MDPGEGRLAWRGERGDGDWTLAAPLDTTGGLCEGTQSQEPGQVRSSWTSSGLYPGSCLSARHLFQDSAQCAQYFFRRRRFQSKFQHAIRGELSAALGRDEAGQLLWVHGGILLELQSDEVAFSLDGVHANLHAQKLERSVVQQIAHCGWGRAVAVLQFGGYVGELRFGFDAGDAFIHLEALVFFGDVVRGNADVEDEVELGFGFVGRGLAFHLADSALEHLRVELKADGFDVAAFLGAQHVACAEEFEIEGSDFETRTEIREFFQRGEAAAGDRREFDLRRKHQVSVGAPVGSSDSSTQLIELREPEPVGAVDQNRVAQRNIEAVLDDRGRNQYVGFVVHEFQHHFFQFAFRHLSVADDNSGFRNKRLDLGGNFPDGVHAVVDEIDLAPALQFLLDRGLN